MGKSHHPLFEGIEGQVCIPKVIRLPVARDSCLGQRVISGVRGRGIDAITRKLLFQALDAASEEVKPRGQFLGLGFRHPRNIKDR